VGSRRVLLRPVHRVDVSSAPTSVSGTAQPFRRDPRTWVHYGQLGLLAFVVDGYAPTVPMLARDLGLALPTAALHGTAFGVGILLGAAVAARATRRLGRAVLTWLGVAGICVGLLAYLLSPVAAGTFAGIAVAGFAGSLMQAAANAQLSDQHGPWGPRAIGESAAVAQAVGIVAPLAIGVATATVVGWRGGLAMVLVAAGALTAVGFVLRRRGHLGAGPGDGSSADEAPEVHQGRLSGRFWVVWCSFAVLLGVEFSMSMWGPTYLALSTGLDAALATASLSLMLLGMMLGRLLFARLTAYASLDRLLAGAIGVCLLGFAGFWTSSVPWAAVASLFVVGLGISGQFPLSFGRLIRAARGRSDDASALSNLAMGIAVCGAPLLLGVLGGAAGIRTGILLVPCLCAVALALLWSSPTSAHRPAGD
jgi:predicted MFS family arabinose efflux permease